MIPGLLILYGVPLLATLLAIVVLSRVARRGERGRSRIASEGGRPTQGGG